ncbi:MAG TPA: DUF302 domain-containing protein [Solirubrobacteraceae bacterium]|nr:DUF302 domain-containing protein [Solirubrobacteraceae bacterium]
MSADGLITIPSSHPVGETIDRLTDAVTSAGLRVFVRIDHRLGAEAVGMPLRPTELLVFGNARGGTPLMQDRQSIGIDLPLKALVWQDEQDRVWLSYNDPAWLARRHELSADAEASVVALATRLAQLAAAATGAR